MWIKMKGTYAGNAGQFLKGMQYDVPDDLLKLLPKGSYEETCAPWDKHVDKQAIELTTAQNKVNDLQVRAERFQAEAEELKQKADSLVAVVAKRQAEAKKAEQAAKQEIARAEKAAKNAEKAPSEDNRKKAADLKAKAWQLAREAERKDAEFQLAHSELSSALARAELKRLDAENAKKQAEAAFKALADLKQKTKAKESNDAKPETEQPADTVDGQVDESIDKEGDRQVTEGQAVSARQTGQ